MGTFVNISILLIVKTHFTTTALEMIEKTEVKKEKLDRKYSSL